MGKLTITGICSIAMLNYQRVYWMGGRSSWFIRFIVLWCWPNRRTQKILKPCCSSKFPRGWWWGVPNHPFVYDNQEYNTRTTDTTDILSTVFGLFGWKMFIPPWPCIHLHYFIFSKTVDIILQEKKHIWNAHPTHWVHLIRFSYITTLHDLKRERPRLPLLFMSLKYVFPIQFFGTKFRPMPVSWSKINPKFARIWVLN